MKQATFGEKINADNEIIVMEFNTSYGNLVEYVNNFYKNVSLNIPWKGHTAINHIRGKVSMMAYLTLKLHYTVS